LSNERDIAMYSHPDNRPRFLNLTAFKFPLNALLSGAHRISGLGLLVSLLGYLVLTNLILFDASVTLLDIRAHPLLLTLHSLFWISLSFHWLTGLRHLLAEHFTQTSAYQRINSPTASAILLSAWFLVIILILVINVGQFIAPECYPSWLS